MTDFEQMLVYARTLKEAGVARYTFASAPDAEHIVTIRYADGTVVSHHFDENERGFATAEY